MTKHWTEIQINNQIFFSYLPIIPVNARDSPVASRDKQEQGRDKRDKQGQSGTFPFCPCLSLLVSVCPCLSLLVCPFMSLSVLVCLCLSLYVSSFAIPSCLPLQMNKTVFISMTIVTLTFLTKGIVPIHANLVCNFFLTCHLPSSITLSFNSYSSILEIKWHHRIHCL